ncbi:TerC family protein [Timonella senegalensis]|uniref:TerC family protein n=1 Tax=Timonella senegalensis TaxID=1465825 RepID=UPI0028A5E8A6|nr:TerC family protein [Timonella senegalensis]
MDSVHIVLWIVTVALILVMLTVDFVGHVRKPHAPTIKEAAVWSAIYIAIAVIFGGIIWGVYGSQMGTEYFAGYLTEKSLSLDNLFVFILIMAAFKVPREDQQKVLLFGIVVALIFRTIFILLGAAVIENYSWVFYIFGAFLVWTAIQQALPSKEEDEYHENALIRKLRTVLPLTDSYVGDRVFVKVDGKRMVTPMIIVMIAIGSADLLFAVDSIPAIFGLTQDPYLVFAANAFSLLGLRQLFFLVDGLLERLVYLNYGLAVILGFIGVKLVLHALHVNELPFINGGQPVLGAPEITIGTSMAVIVGTLVVTTIASLIKDKSDRKKQLESVQG